MAIEAGTSMATPFCHCEEHSDVAIEAGTSIATPFCHCEEHSDVAIEAKNPLGVLNN